MASGGRGDDDDDWEDASDIFEVRSEAESTDTLTPDEQGGDTPKSGQLTVIAPHEDDRRERTPPRVMNQRRGRASRIETDHMSFGILDRGLLRRNIIQRH